MPADPPDPKRLLTQREAAESLSICEKTLFSLRKAGQIRAVLINKAVRFEPAELDAFISRKREGARN
jgi:predicted DNA-binding transcriptional regulator AlpA